MVISLEYYLESFYLSPNHKLIVTVKVTVSAVFFSFLISYYASKSTPLSSIQTCQAGVSDNDLSTTVLSTI